jgi:hypothetical protein
MPKTMTTTTTASIGSDSFVQRFTDTGNSQDGAFPSVPAAKTGVLTTRTDADTGTFTMDPGHGFITSDKIDVFWTVSGVYGSRRNMTATVTSDSAVLDGGTGDNLPVQTSPITAMKPTVVLLDVIGNNVKALAVNAPQGGYVVFCDGGGDLTAATYKLTSTSPGASWSTASGATNPLATKTVVSVKFSHGLSSGAVDMIGTVIYG